jgi:hypothetical protein
MCYLKHATHLNAAWQQDSEVYKCKGEVSALLTHHARRWSHHTRWWSSNRHAGWTRLLWPHLRRSWHLWSPSAPRSHHLLGRTTHTSDWALKTCDKVRYEGSVLKQSCGSIKFIVLLVAGLTVDTLENRSPNWKHTLFNHMRKCSITTSRLIADHSAKFITTFMIFLTIHD